MKDDKVLLFLDVDGVFNVPGDAPQDRSGTFVLGFRGFPSPLAVPFLLLIDAAPHIVPMWMSAWGIEAQSWNRYARTRRFKCAYPLEQSFASLEDVRAWSQRENPYRQYWRGSYLSKPMRELIHFYLQKPVFQEFERDPYKLYCSPSGMDEKTLAAMVAAHDWDGKIVWIEDGHPNTAIAWTKTDERVHLIDTTTGYPQPIGLFDWLKPQLSASLKIKF